MSDQNSFNGSYLFGFFQNTANYLFGNIFWRTSAHLTSRIKTLVVHSAMSKYARCMRFRNSMHYYTSPSVLLSLRKHTKNSGRTFYNGRITNPGREWECRDGRITNSGREWECRDGRITNFGQEWECHNGCITNPGQELECRDGCITNSGREWECRDGCITNPGREWECRDGRITSFGRKWECHDGCITNPGQE